MNKKLVLILLVVFLCLSSGCGEGFISKEKYDELLLEKEQLSTELQEMRNSKAEELEKEMEDSKPENFIRAWAEQVFGEDTICVIDGSIAFVSVKSKYNDFSEETITNISSDIINAQQLLTYAGLESSLDGAIDVLDTVTVIFRNTSDECILMFTLESSSGQWFVKDMSGNLMHLTEIVEFLISMDENDLE